MGLFTRLSLGVAFVSAGGERVGSGWGPPLDNVRLSFGAATLSRGDARVEDVPLTLRGFSIGVVLPQLPARAAPHDLSAWGLAFAGEGGQRPPRRPRVLWSKRVGM